MRDKWIVGTIVLAVGLLFSGFVSGSDAAGTRIGYVDVQRVIVRSVAGVAAREQLERDKVTMQKDVDNRKVEVDKLREEMEKKGLVLSAESRREKEETLQRKVRDLRRLAEDLEKELQKKEQAGHAADSRGAHGHHREDGQGARLPADRGAAERRGDLR